MAPQNPPHLVIPVGRVLAKVPAWSLIKGDLAVNSLLGQVGGESSVGHPVEEKATDVGGPFTSREEEESESFHSQ